MPACSCPTRGHPWVLALLLGALLAPAGARADEPVTIELIAKGQQGSSSPALVLRGHAQVDRVVVDLRCGAVHVEHQGSLGSGERLELPIAIPVGRARCSGKLAAIFADGEGEMPLSFEVEQFAPLQIRVPRERLDLAGQRLVLSADRAVGQVELEIYGETGNLLGTGSATVAGIPAHGSVDAEWSAKPGDVIHIHVKVQDVDGFWAGVDLFPWSYAIPHEDVVFDTARWDILPAEEPKVAAALEQAQAVLRRFSSTQVAMNLYVGGYTDTVGDPGYNQQLSESRARAIAGWFEAHGFARPIYYQGFGEGAPAVATPDETDEQRNRRATYVISAEEPPFSADFPRSAWKRLD